MTAHTSPFPKHPPPSNASQTLRLDGCAVCCRLTEPALQAKYAPGLPVLFLHGLGCSGNAWQPVLDTLAADGCAQTVAVPDLPGYGHSGCKGGVLGIDALADWAARLLDTLGLARVHVAGQSMGCQVALALARRHPARVGGLVLLGPTTGRRLVPLVRYAGGLLCDGFCEPLRYNLTLLRMYGEMGLVRYAATIRRMMQDDPIAHAAEVAAPCLVLLGARDQVVPLRAARALAEALPQARLTQIPRAPHAAQFSRPAEFLALALPFWQEAGEPTNLLRQSPRTGIPS